MKELLSIHEFSKFSGIEASTLRYWDSIGLFSPVKRDPETNYRFYTPDQIIAVKYITVMSGLKIPLKMIGELKKERSPVKIVRLIENRQKMLDMEMRKLRECYSIIHARLDLIHHGMRVEDGFYVKDGVRIDKGCPTDGGTWVDENEIAVLRRDDLSYILGPEIDWPEGEKFYDPYAEFCTQAEKRRINLSFPVGAIHKNMEDFAAAPGSPRQFISLDPTGNEKRPKGEYLVGYTRGYYGQLGDIAERMKKYASENSLKVEGLVYTIYLHDEICVEDPSQYLSQVSVSVTKEKAAR